MSRRTIGITLGLVVVTILVVGCPGTDRETPDADAVEMRASTIPEGYEAGQFRNDIRASLSTGETKLGTAITYTDGSVVVTAPRGVHDGIERLLADLRARGPAPRPLPADTVTRRDWAILAKPGDAEPSRSGALRTGGPLDPVIEELTAAYGPMKFGLLEELRVTGTADRDKSSYRGRLLHVEQRVTREDDGSAIARIGMSMLPAQGGRIHTTETQVRLVPGEFIVLAQSAYDSAKGQVPPGWNPGDDIMLFLVVAEQAD